MTDLNIMEEVGEWLETVDQQVIGMRLLAAELRRFAADHATEIPNYIHQTQATANMIDVVADRIERRNQ